MLEICEYDQGIILKGVHDFELKHIFECGQCFRWNNDSDGGYIGVASGRVVRISSINDDIYIKGGKIEEKIFWADYFDLDVDYGDIKKELSKDKILCEAVKHGKGIRILNQEPFEIIISFIISANNRIPMIKKAVEIISRKFGNQIEFEGKVYYSFPTPDALSEANLADLDCCGFRASYIIDTTRRIANGEINISHVKNMDLNDAHEELIKLRGIGPKVADCILLFSMKKHGAFPVDVWVKRIMQYFYMAPDVSLKKIRDFGMDKFEGYAGYAQQYLFYYAREKKIGAD